LARKDNQNAIMEVFRLGSLPPMEAVSERNDPDAGSEEDPYDSY